MKNPHTFVVSSFAVLTTALAVTGFALAPVQDNKAGTAAGFSFFITTAAAAAALTITASFDALAARR